MSTYGPKSKLSLLSAAAGHTVMIAQITRAEIVSAASRRKREGQISARTAHASREYKVVGLRDQVVQHAEDLLEAHPLRAYDAVQLASALEVDVRLATARLSPLIFVSSDKQLLAVAAAEGLATDDPESHP